MTKQYKKNLFMTKQYKKNAMILGVYGITNPEFARFAMQYSNNEEKLDAILKWKMRMEKTYKNVSEYYENELQKILAS